jgi:hypothetical protein
VGVVVFLFAVFVLICQLIKCRKKYELHNGKFRIRQSWIDKLNEVEVKKSQQYAAEGPE